MHQLQKRRAALPRFSLYHFVNLMVGYLVGRFGFFQMEKLKGNLMICDAWRSQGLTCDNERKLIFEPLAYIENTKIVAGYLVVAIVSCVCYLFDLIWVTTYNTPTDFKIP